MSFKARVLKTKKMAKIKIKIKNMNHPDTIREEGNWETNCKAKETSKITKINWVKVRSTAFKSKAVKEGLPRQKSKEVTQTHKSKLSMNYAIT